MSKFLDRTNMRYRMLFIVKYKRKDDIGKYLWLCRCDCVKSIIFKDENLVNLYEPYLIQKYQPKYNNDLLEKFEFELPEIKL